MRRISEQIAEMIGDGDCLQMGSAACNTVLAMIGDRRHLGIHTELLTDGIVDLYRAGAIDGSRKTVLPGRIVCTFAGGTRRSTTSSTTTRSSPSAALTSRTIHA